MLRVLGCATAACDGITHRDLVATVYHLVGGDPEATVPDHTNRPTAISHGGKPIAGVIR